MATTFGSWWQKSKLRSWWQKIRQHPFIPTGVIVVIFALIVFSFAVYIFGWDWTGFRGGESKTTITSTSNHITTAKELQPGKTLWDWLGLLATLAIPVVVGFGAAWFTAQQGKVSDAESKDNQRETRLQAYLDRMTELLLKEDLRTSKPDNEVRKIARVRTLTALCQLDAYRNAYVLTFLHETGLVNIDTGKCIINLTEADLGGVNLSKVNLNKVNLSKVNLRGADLSGADLRGADLSGADLRETNMGLLYSSLTMHGYPDPKGTRLSKADLSGADLSEADLRSADLSEASMYGTKLDKADLSQAILHSAKLEGAKLIETKLNGAYLDNANLNGANLSRANLRGASLQGTSLTGSEAMAIKAMTSPEYLPEEEKLSRGADLEGADLRDADLSRANLQGANVTLEQLGKVKSLRGAIMPDGLIHP